MDPSSKALLSDQDPEKGQDVDAQPTSQTQRSPFLRATRQTLESLQRLLLPLASGLILLLLWDDINLRRNSWQLCQQDTATPSPFLTLTSEYKTVKFNGSFGPDTPWRLPPGSEVDQLWNSIAKVDNVAVSFDEVRDMGKVPEDMKRVPPALRAQYGDGIVVIAEFGHQLHCLNLVRKFTYLDHYGDELLNEIGNTKVLRTHVDHCIDIVRQALMCNADPGFVTSYWVEGRELAMPDFSTNHKCRNLDAMIDWVDQHKMGEQAEAGPFPDEKVWTRYHHP